MKIPNGAAAVSAEDARNGFDFAKPSTANFRGKERAFPVMRKSEDLLGEGSACGNGWGVFCCRKSAAAACELPQFRFL